MTDYSFMRSGLSSNYNPIDTFSIEDLEILLAIFVKNSIKNASRHVKICGRSGVTKEDMELGLKYEVFDFFKNPDNVRQIQELKAEAEAEAEAELVDCECPCTCDCECGVENPEECECECMGECECTCEIETTEQLLFGDNVVPDSEIQEFSRMSLTNIENVEDNSDKEFIKNYYNYADKWNTWKPETPLEFSLFNAVNKIV